VPQVGNIQGPKVGGDIAYVGTTDERRRKVKITMIVTVPVEWTDTLYVTLSTTATNQAPSRRMKLSSVTIEEIPDDGTV
jgi:hypothetical protein